MDLYGQKSKSIPQKIVIHLIEIVFLWGSYWILFQQGASWVQEHLHVHNSTGGHERRVIIFAFNIITFIRLAYMMFFLLKRKVPWEESISVPFAFAIYFIGYPLFVLPANIPFNWLDYFAIAIFITGCILNSGGEVLRNIWKKKPGNKGKIYTQGFFKYSRHINYFGDILWVTGYAIITSNWYAASIPVFIFCFFAFYNAPMLDKHLKTKYGEDYINYAKKVKMLIPFIY
jgi:protein-S-isoprenylcysteine O-methyltransferase Ste14